jgi:hypothetical protein
MVDGKCEGRRCMPILAQQSLVGACQFSVIVEINAQDGKHTILLSVDVLEIC